MFFPLKFVINVNNVRMKRKDEEIVLKVGQKVTKIDFMFVKLLKMIPYYFGF